MRSYKDIKLWIIRLTIKLNHRMEVAVETTGGGGDEDLEERNLEMAGKTNEDRIIKH